MKPGTLTKSENTLLQQGICPDCGAKVLLDGPRGGLAMNTLCAECRTEFNSSLIQSERLAQPCALKRQFEVYGISTDMRPVMSFGNLDPLTQEDMNVGLHEGCGNPECNCHGKPIDELFLNARCHPRANVKASYAKGGFVLIRCAACGKLVVKIAVAP